MALAIWKGATEFVSFMRSQAGQAEPRAIQTTGRVAIKMQGRIKDNLEAAVYSQPPAASGYRRTRTLFRSVVAAPPDADHSGDEGAAHGGQDLAVDSPGRAAAVQSGGKIGSEIGSHVRYSEAVQEGANGVPPREFISDADVDEAERLLGDAFEKEVQIMLGGSN